MTVPRCPKCGARPTHTQQGMYHCIMCGSDWTVPREAQKPAVPKAILKPIKLKPVFNKKHIEEVIEKMVEKTEPTARPSSGRRGTCTNCERTNIFIKNSKGLCSSCSRAVEGIAVDAPEYAGVLAAAKEKFQAKPLPVNFEKVGKQKTNDIVQTLKDRRHQLMMEVEEITTLINGIEKYAKAA